MILIMHHKFAVLSFLTIGLTSQSWSVQYSYLHWLHFHEVLILLLVEANNLNFKAIHFVVLCSVAENHTKIYRHRLSSKLLNKLPNYSSVSAVLLFYKTKLCNMVVNRHWLGHTMLANYKHHPPIQCPECIMKTCNLCPQCLWHLMWSQCAPYHRYNTWGFVDRNTTDCTDMLLSSDHWWKWSIWFRWWTYGC